MTILLAMLLALGDDALIADFEGKDYGAWTATGTAFGAGPARGTLPNQMPVSGFLGKGLVNSYHGGDASVGTLTSPAFTIDHKAINFLIGGGRHPGETVINLLIGDKVVRSSTGTDSEQLDWDGWDVAEFAGKSATLQIVDKATGGWGHINVDQIVQADVRKSLEPRSRELTLTSRYLHLPVRTGQPKRVMKLIVDDAVVRQFEIELVEKDPQFWAVVDVGAWKGKTLKLEAATALDGVKPSDDLPTADSPVRPAFHFTSR